MKDLDGKPVEAGITYICRRGIPAVVTHIVHDTAYGVTEEGKPWQSKCPRRLSTVYMENQNLLTKEK